MDDAKTAVDVYRIIIMYIATSLDRIFGGCDGVFITLVVFLSFDYVTGILSAISNKNLSSRIGAIGILKKLGILCVIALTSLVEDTVFKTNTLRNAVILYYISNEGISIMENFLKLGIPIPTKLKNIFLNMKNENDDEKSAP